MAEEIVGVKVKVQGEGFQSVGELKKAIKEAQNETLRLTQAFGASSQQATAAAERAGDLTAQLGDLKARINQFDPDKKMKAFAAGAQFAAGAIASVQGAMGLLGAESKDLEKAMLKVQSALAFSQGINQMVEAREQLGNLGAKIKGPVVKAFTTLRGAMAALGIGALVVGIGLLIANFDKIKKAVMDTFPGLAKFTDFIGGLITKVTDFVGVTSAAGRATAKLIEDNNKAIAASERFLDLNGDKYDEYTQRKIKANNEFKKRQNEFLNDEKLSEDERNRYIQQAREKANREILAADADRNKKADEARKQEAQKAKQAADQRAQQAKQEAAARIAERKQLEGQLKALREENALQAITDENERERARIAQQQANAEAEINSAKVSEELKQQLLYETRLKYGKQLMALDQRIADETAAKAKETADAKAARDKEAADAQAALEQSNYQKRLEAFKTFATDESMTAQQKLAFLDGVEKQLTTEVFKNESERTALMNAAKEARKQINEAEYQNKASQVEAIGVLFGQLSGIIGEQTKAGKALALTQIGIDTGLAISALNVSSFKDPKNAFTSGLSGTLQFASGMVRILANVAKAKKMLTSGNSVPTAGGGGAPMPNLATAAPVQAQAATVNTATQLQQQQINDKGNNIVRAYVVEQDISKAQERISRIERTARIG